MILTYAEIPIEKLKFGVNRPKRWWDEHPNSNLMIYKMIKSIFCEGLKNPLSAINNNDDTYTVTVGNQRLQALTEMDTIISVAPTIIASKEGQDYIIGKRIKVRDIKSYYKSDISNLVLNPNIFQTTPADVNKWNGDVVFRK